MSIRRRTLVTVAEAIAACLCLLIIAAMVYLFVTGATD